MSLNQFARRAALLCCVSLFVRAQQPATGWQAEPRTVERATRQQPDFNFDEARVPAYKLPEPLQPGTTRATWRRRRRQVLESFRAQVYGRSPGRPEELRFQLLEENPQAMSGAATLKRIAVISTHAKRRHKFELTIFLPNSSTRPAPLLLLLNHRPASNTDATRKEQSDFWPAEKVIARGYAVAALQTSELAPDNAEHFRDGVMRLYETAGTTTPRPRDAWGALAAWAWGASRAMDYFAQEPRINAKRVGVVGHSRGGKAALWAGAEDERFALVVSNDSGEGGASLARRQFGETTAQINKTFPYWFADNFKNYNARENTLPVDQHMLLALIAPRAVYVASAGEDLWSDPRGEFLSLAYSSPVYALWGDAAVRVSDMPPLDRPLIRGRRGYHIRTGGHNLTAYDWERFMDFADHLFRHKSPVGWPKTPRPRP